MKHQFKPFDQVLVRHNIKYSIWSPSLFGFCKDKTFICAGGLAYDECIPYNENTAHLIGTTINYKPEDPKEWEVRSTNGLFVEKFTSDELQNFINTAVIQNKDITNFNIARIF